MALQIQDLVVRDGVTEILQLPEWRLDTPAQGLLRGPSGSGKTTLLHVLSGLQPVTRGTIELDGQTLTNLSRAAFDMWRGRHIGFVFQDLHIVSHLTVRQNIVLAASLTGQQIDADWLAHIIALLGLQNLQERRARALSTGEKQRVAIARAIVARPELLLADEPTSGLDDANAHKVAGLLRQAADEAGATLLIATHDARLEQDFPIVLNLAQTHMGDAA